MATAKLSFKQFLATKAYVADKRTVSGWEEYESTPCFLYVGSLVIELCADGKFCLLLSNNGGEISEDITKLERILYNWADGEGYLASQ